MTDVTREITVVDNPAAARYEAHLDGELASFVDYHLTHGTMALVHTETLPGFGGQGIATALIKSTLDSVRARGVTVLPSCSFVSEYIRAHQEYLDLVPERRRAQFDL
jgi:predicted GNAT family acetyltransferase